MLWIITPNYTQDLAFAERLRGIDVVRAANSAPEHCGETNTRQSQANGVHPQTSKNRRNTTVLRSSSRHSACRRTLAASGDSDQFVGISMTPRSARRGVAPAPGVVYSAPIHSKIRNFRSAALKRRVFFISRKSLICDVQGLFDFRSRGRWLRC
jgi:hypothetical protein